MGLATGTKGHNRGHNRRMKVLKVITEVITEGQNKSVYSKTGTQE